MKFILFFMFKEKIILELKKREIKIQNHSRLSKDSIGIITS
jgi:hypothetical protein